MKLSESPDIVPRINLVDMVRGRIQAWIIKGEIKPGEKLPSEKEMMLHFKVAKSVIREAISRLHALQMVDTFQGKGSFVSQESRKVIIPMEVETVEDEFSNHLRELREIFEPNIAKLAAQRGSESDLKKLWKLIEEMDTAIQHNEMGFYEDDLLHYTLAQSTHNPILEKVTINIARMSEPYKRLSLARPFRSVETREEWYAIVQAVEERDAQAAWQAMYRHIQNSMGTLLESRSRAIDHLSEIEAKSNGSYGEPKMVD
jgi:GntR family transcriptional repressor for pyruvate dehydrogenase complex